MKMKMWCLKKYKNNVIVKVWSTISNRISDFIENIYSSSNKKKRMKIKTREKRGKSENENARKRRYAPW